MESEKRNVGEEGPNGQTAASGPQQDDFKGAVEMAWQDRKAHAGPSDTGEPERAAQRSNRLDFFNRDRVADGRLATGGAASAADEATIEGCRRRMRKEMDEREAAVRKTVVLDFLEVADALERGLVACEDTSATGIESVKDGIESILRLFRSKLERYAVTIIQAEGEAFDPARHHAVAQAISADIVPGTVVRELQKGYRMDGRLLRPAAVVVATPPRIETSDVESTGGDVGSAWHRYRRNRR